MQAGKTAIRGPHKPEKPGAAPGPATTTRKLTDKQALFVTHYLIHLNATKAAALAGYSPKTSMEQGYQLLRNPSVAAAVAEGAQRTAAKLELTKDRIYQETARIAFFDPRKLYAPDGRPLQLTELDDDTAAAIAGVEVLEQFDGFGNDRVLTGHVKKYRVADKAGALSLGSKLLALFEEHNKQKEASTAEVARQFFAQLHSAGAGRLPIAPSEGKPQDTAPDSAPLGGQG